jgi:hypothetical protein
MAGLRNEASSTGIPHWEPGVGAGRGSRAPAATESPPNQNAG